MNKKVKYHYFSGRVRAARRCGGAPLELGRNLRTPAKIIYLTFPQELFKSLCISCEQLCVKQSTVLKNLAEYVLNTWKSRGCGKVVHEFYYEIYTEKIGYFSLLGGKFYTFST